MNKAEKFTAVFYYLLHFILVLTWSTLLNYIYQPTDIKFYLMKYKSIDNIIPELFLYIMNPNM